jgi:hypothetical protein
MKYTTCLLKRYGKVLLAGLAVAVGAAVMLGSTCSVLNKAPSVPVITGPSAGVVGVPVTFKATATDPESDSIAFQFDWGDTTTLAWTNLFASGETVSVQHSYTNSGTFSVRAKVKDRKAGTSGWSPGTTLQLDAAGPAYPDSIIGKLHVLRVAVAAVVTPDGRTLYVGHGEQDVVTPVRLVDRTVLDTVKVGRNATSMAVSPDGAHVYVCARNSGTLVSVRTSDNVVDNEVVLANYTGAVAIAPDGQFAYVTAPDSECLYVVRTADFGVVDTIRLGHWCTYLTMVPASGVIYVSMDSVLVGVVSTGERRLVSTVDVAGLPGILAASPDGEHVYVVVGADSGFVDIQTSTNTVVSRTRTSSGIQSVTVTPDGAYVLAADQYGIRYVNAATGVVVDSLFYHGGVGGVPAVFPGGDSIYIPSRETLYVVGKH